MSHLPPPLPDPAPPAERRGCLTYVILSLPFAAFAGLLLRPQWGERLGWLIIGLGVACSLYGAYAFTGKAQSRWRYLAQFVTILYGLLIGYAVLLCAMYFASCALKL